jgi:hypothetical protein
VRRFARVGSASKQLTLTLRGLFFKRLQFDEFAEPRPAALSADADTGSRNLTAACCAVRVRML